MLQQQQPVAEYIIKCSDKLCISAKRTEQGECVVIIQKDKNKIYLSLEEYSNLGRQKDCIELACYLLKGELGLERADDNTYGRILGATLS